MPYPKRTWKEVPFGPFFFMKSLITLLLWPMEAIVKLPILFKRITAGMVGNTQTVAMESRYLRNVAAQRVHCNKNNNTPPTSESANIVVQKPKFEIRLRV